MQEARLDTKVFLWIGYIRVLEEMSINNPWRGVKSAVDLTVG